MKAAVSADLLGLLSRLGVGFALTDASTAVLATDPQYAAILGRSPHAMAGVRMAEVTHPDDSGCNQWMLRIGGGFDIRKRYLRADGQVQWVENRVVPLGRETDQPMFLVASRPIDGPSRPADPGASTAYLAAYLIDMCGQLANLAEESNLALSAELLRQARAMVAEEAGLDDADD